MRGVTVPTDYQKNNATHVAMECFNDIVGVTLKLVLVAIASHSPC